MAVAPKAPEIQVEFPVHATTVRLYGILNPGAEGEAGSYEFLYKQGKAGCAGGGKAPEPAGMALGLENEIVSEMVSGLAPNMEYTACVRVENTSKEATVGSATTFKTALPPEIPTEQAANPVAATTATLHGTLNPHAKGEADIYRFYYRQSADQCQGGTPEEDKETTAEQSSGQEKEAVQASVGGLLPNTQYSFCLGARNNVEEEAVGTSEKFTTPIEAPIVSDEFPSNVGVITATLGADVDPGGTPTSYHIEYGTSTSYGTSVPVPDAAIGAETTPVAVSQEIGGLQADTVYHFRVLSSNSLGNSEGRDQTFVTQPAGCPNAASRQGPSVALPDCRVYEQVTPLDKGDSTDLFSRGEGASAQNPDTGYASDDGNSFLLSTVSANFAGGVSGENTYVFSRGADGWLTTAIAPTGLGVQNIRPATFSPSTGFADIGVTDIIGAAARTTSNEQSPKQIDALTGPPAGPYAISNSEELLPELPNFRQPSTKIAGASADLSNLVLEGFNHDLAPGDTGQDSESSALYEAVGGQLRLVNVANNGSLLSPCGAVLGMGTNGVQGGTYRAVSSDGSKVFLTAPDPEGNGPGCWQSSASPQVDTPQLYMRVNGARTVEVSAPEPGVDVGTANNPVMPAVYVGASADGSNVFFVTETELTANDKGHAPELYDYNTDTSTLTRVSRGESGEAEGNVDFVAAISSGQGAEGIQVYFTAFGPLTSGTPAPAAEQVNLYRYATGTGKTTYIATVGSREYPNSEFGVLFGLWNLRALPSSRGPSELALDSRANWYTTSDGQYLVFASHEILTGHDHAGSNCEMLESGSHKCTEVYRYDAADNSIVCASCGPGGTHEVDDAQFARSALQMASGTSPRPVSEDGSYVFFDTATALVPQAVSGLTHVYEWHNGVISLISSVADPSKAYFMGSSADGQDVFFGTHAQLARQDTDESGDLYDARIDGGFEGLAPSVCTGTGCQGLPAAAPIFATPASVTFVGVGNFSPSAGMPVKPKTKPLTKAQRLAKALKLCKRDQSKRKRTECERRAKKQYGGAHKSSKANRRGK